MPTPTDIDTLMAELDGYFALGELGVRAGIQGSRELQNHTAEFLAGLLVKLGITPTDLPPLPESGQLPTVLGRAVAGAWTRLTQGARRAVEIAAKHQGLVLTVGAFTLGHAWLSGNENVQLQRLREESEFVRFSWNNASPEDRKRIVAGFLGQGDGPGFGTIALTGLALGAVYFGLKLFFPPGGR